jgi:hypothetical protein
LPPAHFKKGLALTVFLSDKEVVIIITRLS